MKLNELSPLPGSKGRRKRVGRGYGSNSGHTSGRGNKGQKSRSGGSIRRGFEGGQLALVKRMPSKRGFTNIFRIEYAAVNLDRLNVFESGAEVTPETLVARRILRSLRRPVKVLGEGELTRPLVVKVNRFSQSALRKIEAAGGKAEILS
ncbi:MAG: 50S ribosomal protein L15 [Dehalococcoidia bacterium]